MRNQIEITNYLIDVIILPDEICLEFHLKSDEEMISQKLLFEKDDALILAHLFTKMWLGRKPT